MVITLTQPTSGYIGQGVTLFASTDIDLTVNPPYQCFCAVSDFLAGLQATSGHNSVTAAAFTMLLGFDELSGQFTPPQNGLDLGHALSVQVNIFDASFTLADTGTFAGFFHDPISGYGGLLQRLLLSGGLTPPQQAQLDEVLANTQGGTFHFPLIGIVTTSLDPASPIPGAAVTNLTVPSATQVLGVTWQVNTPSPTSGETIGVIAEWSKRLLQIVVFHSLAGGATFADQVFETHADSGTLWFDSADPAGVTVFVWPAFTVDVSWLVIP